MKTTLCIVSTRQKAEDIMHRLEAEGFSDEYISVVFPIKGALDLPGLGTFIASGPIIATLRRAAGTAGGLAVGLAALGVAKTEALLCEQDVEEGNFLLSVHANAECDMGRARDIFAALGARLIPLGAEDLPRILSA